MCLFFQIILVQCISVKLTEFELFSDKLHTIADSMVMSVDIIEKEEIVENIRDDAPEDNEKARVSDTEKELAAEASSAYNCGDFNGCLTSLEKLEVSFQSR